MMRVAAAMMALMVCGVTTAAIINVPGDYGSTIQAAVDAANNGDVILVAPGTYTGTGYEVVNTLGKAITLRSTYGATVTIIDGEGARRVVECSNSEGADTIIEGFTIKRGSVNDRGGGIRCNDGSSPTIRDCTISDNTSSHTYQYYGNGGGISCTDSSSPTISDCTIKNNTASNCGGGIYCASISNPTITDCEIIHNTADTAGGGIYSSSGNGPTLTDTEVCWNDPGNIYGPWTDGGGNTICENDSGNGACCIGDNCFVVAEIGCYGDWLGEGTDCSGNPCYVPPTGACCNGENCTVTTEAGCNGDWLGEGTDCSGNPCYVPPTGACCNGENCTVTTEAGCNGDWLGDETTCSDGCPSGCPDVSGDGFVAVHDLLAVLEAWSSDDPDADVNGDGIVGMDDLTAVIKAWGPCP